MILEQKSSGTLKIAPGRFHNSDQNEIFRSTTTGLRLNISPNILGSMTFPTIICNVEGNTNAKALHMLLKSGSNSIKGLGKITATIAPRLGMKLAKNATKPKIQDNRTFNNHKIKPVRNPTKRQMVVFKRM
mmetsp:Transcript_3437/g.5351  ORF Transcript_3437/g.5351 Transcript_3437/m.5351 type:complete len:131 (-) Transcript_3437:344-736(-)